MGDWKYIAPSHSKRKNQKARLYNLKKDVGEQYNLIDKNPEIAKDMKETLNQYIINGRMRK
jgi:arylsulfatase A-like enzyme